jgi:uncharacterized FAD-dependent dehydrogenase
MIRIQQLKLIPGHSEEDLKKAVSKQLSCNIKEILEYKIIKKSIDARKKNEIKFIYTVDVDISHETRFLKRNKNKNISLAVDKIYTFPEQGEQRMSHRPIVIGSGPAGLYCALMLARNGYAPILLERGEDVEKRQKTVEHFWKTGELNTQSNVQFGEGGAGTFSDGKLNTLVKDSSGRNKKVLEIFVEAGAPEEILYLKKPHIGTDILRKVVKNIREEILLLGGEVRFLSQVTDFIIEKNQLKAVEVNGKEILETETAVLAVGHSARDTFELLDKKAMLLTPKSFAIGLRIEHSQNLINHAQYGDCDMSHLPTAEYKAAKTLPNGRGVYSFCMCPGGWVVDASSEKNKLAINGMSYHARDSRNANSAVIVTVTPEDFPVPGALAGLAFQRKLEESAYQLGNGKVPVQLYGDFCKNRPSTKLGDISPCIKGNYELSNVREIFPAVISASIEEGIRSFAQSISGFDKYDAVLSGVESRTSSPLRIVRNHLFESNIAGIYPCGEGAGYAGGITSAAMDGIKAAEAIARKFRSL